MKADKTSRIKFYKLEGGAISTSGSPLSKHAYIAYWAGKRLYTMEIDRREFAKNLREARKNRKDAANDH